MQRTAALPRSRFGCMTCRDKHRKCDEKKPTCGQCDSRGVKCAYGSMIKWANPGSISSINHALRRKKQRPRGARVRNSIDEPATLSDLPERTQAGSNGQTSIAKDRSNVDEEVAVAEPKESPRAVLRSTDARIERHDVGVHSETISDDADFHAVSDGTTWSMVDQPTVASAFDTQSHLAALDTVSIHETVEGDGSVSDIPCSLHEVPSPNGFSSWAVDHTLNSLLFQIFDTPNEEIAFNYFFKHVCSVISAYDTPQNPWRKLTIVALSHPVLLHGLLAVSTAYMYNHGRSHESILSTRESRAVNSLQLALKALQCTNTSAGTSPADNDCSGSEGGSVFSILSTKEVVLAAVTMQTCSILMSGIGAIEDHLLCALHFIRELGLFYRAPRTDFIWLFVYRFATVDVLLSLFRFRRPHAPLDFFMYQVNPALDEASPSFRDQMGFSQRVLCFLAHVSVLSAQLDDSTESAAHVQAKAHRLETEMRVWGQHFYDRMTQSLQSETSSPYPSFSQHGPIDQRLALDIVAECHYWVAHLLLMRRVFLDPTESIRVQMVRKYLFRLMDLLPAGCGPDSCLNFPLYLAAREAISEEDQHWVRRKHAALMNIYRHQSRSHVMLAVEEVWRQSSVPEKRSTEAASPLETAKEKFIRDMDRSSTYFMF